MNILIIEDKEDRIETLKTLYSTFKPRVASEVEIAKDILSSNSFDLVHLDYDLNETTTEELAGSFSEETKVVIHSENTKGVKLLLNLIENSIAIPFHKFVGKSPELSHLKAVLSTGVKRDILIQLTQLEMVTDL